MKDNFERMSKPNKRPLPKPDWVGLTDEELYKITRRVEDLRDLFFPPLRKFAKEIEDQLKRKNS